MQRSIKACKHICKDKNKCMHVCCKQQPLQQENAEKTKSFIKSNDSSNKDICKFLHQCRFKLKI